MNGPTCFCAAVQTLTPNGIVGPTPNADTCLKRNRVIVENVVAASFMVVADGGAMSEKWIQYLLNLK